MLLKFFVFMPAVLIVVLLLSTRYDVPSVSEIKTLYTSSFVLPVFSIVALILYGTPVKQFELQSHVMLLAYMDAYWQASCDCVRLATVVVRSDDICTTQPDI